MKNYPVDEFLPAYLGTYTYNHPDLNKFKVRKSASERDLYFAYAQECANENKSVEFNFQQFKEYISIYNALMVQEMTSKATILKLPYGLGEVLISGFYGRYFKPRFTREGVERYTNPHTQGKIFKFAWVKDKIKGEYTKYWRHKASAYLKHNIFKEIFNNGADAIYHMIDRESEGLTKSEQVKNARKKEKGLIALAKEKKEAIIKEGKRKRNIEE